MINKNNKYIRKIRHDAKALSPVVASIILIAVTVAVSIAVAAWMGGMTIGFMGSSSLTVTNVDFADDGTDKTIVLDLKNTGTKTVTIAAVRINDQLVRDPNGSWETADLVHSIDAGKNATLSISGTLGTWTPGDPYKIDLYDSSNQVVGSMQQNSPGT